jgi:hypothetical protein
MSAEPVFQNFVSPFAIALVSAVLDLAEESPVAVTAAFRESTGQVLSVHSTGARDDIRCL